MLTILTLMETEAPVIQERRDAVAAHWVGLQYRAQQLVTGAGNPEEVARGLEMHAGALTRTLGPEVRTLVDVTPLLPSVREKDYSHSLSSA